MVEVEQLGFFKVCQTLTGAAHVLAARGASGWVGCKRLPKTPPAEVVTAARCGWANEDVKANWTRELVLKLR